MGLFVTTALLAIVIVPASLWALGGLFHLPTQTSTRMVIKTVAESVLGPMAIGLGVGHFSPVAARAGKRVTTFATILLLAAALPIIVRSWPAFRTLIGNGTLAAIVAFTLGGLGVGHFLGGPVREHRTVLALATASRHPAVAIVIATTDFPGNKLIAAAVLLALLVSAVASAPYVAWSKRRAGTRHRPATPATTATPGAGSTSVGGLHVGHSRSRDQ
jgi:BASS family bile acid:Na+ symporter